MKHLKGAEVLGRCGGFVPDNDDTITSSYPNGIHNPGLHEMSRREALRRLGLEIGNEALVNYPDELNNTSYDRTCSDARLPATLRGTVWTNLVDCEVVRDGADFNPEHPFVLTIERYKDEVHPDLIAKYATEVPGSTKFIRAMSQLCIPSVVCSSAPRPEVGLCLQTLGLSDIYDWQDHGNVVGYGDVPKGMHKPHPEAYLTAIRRLPPTFKNGLSVAIDDNMNGIKSAVLADCFVFGVTSRKTESQLMDAEVPPHMAGTFEDFGQWLGLPGY